jgi:hypothetical protein
MHNFLYFIGEYLIAINVIALFIGALAFPKRTAFMSVLLFVVILQLFHMWYENYLIGVLAKSLDKNTIRLFWYMGFAVTDFLMIVCAVSYCKFTDVVRDKASNLILINVATLGAVQMIRYADRILIGTDILSPIYKLAVPVLNFSITVTICFYLAYSCGTEILKLLVNKRVK